MFYQFREKPRDLQNSFVMVNTMLDEKPGKLAKRLDVMSCSAYLHVNRLSKLARKTKKRFKKSESYETL